MVPTLVQLKYCIIFIRRGFRLSVMWFTLNNVEKLFRSTVVDVPAIYEICPGKMYFISRPNTSQQWTSVAFNKLEKNIDMKKTWYGKAHS